MKKFYFLLVAIYSFSAVIHAQNRVFNLIDFPTDIHLSADLSNNAFLETICSKAIQVRAIKFTNNFQNSSQFEMHDTLLLNLFDKKSFRATIDKVQMNVNGSKIIRSRLEGFKLGYSLLSIAQGHSTLLIEIPEKNESYITRYDSVMDQYYLIQLDCSKVNILEGSPPIISPSLSITNKSINKKSYQSNDLRLKSKSVVNPDSTNSIQLKDTIQVSPTVTQNGNKEEGDIKAFISDSLNNLDYFLKKPFSVLSLTGWQKPNLRSVDSTTISKKLDDFLVQEKDGHILLNQNEIVDSINGKKTSLINSDLNTAQTTFNVYGIISNFYGSVDSDYDGYFDTYSFDVGIDGDASPGPTTVYMKIICNTTGQSWWSSTSFIVTGTVTDYKYFTFNQADFSSMISGNTDLDFTVELWDSSKAYLLASDGTVTGEPVHADIITGDVYRVYGIIDSFSGTSDSDNDGYYSNYSFNIGIDADAIPGPSTVYMKMICNTTGQSWWSSTAFTVSGNTSDYVYFSFNQSYFSNYINGNTDLDFTVELWNSSKTVLLAVDNTVTGEPVQADLYSGDTYAVYAKINSFSGISDLDNDGYYDTYSFNIGIDGDASPGPSTVYMKMICNTTGQSWWSSTAFSISGTAADYKYFTFNQSFFASQLSGNAALDFTVELWDYSKALLLASNASVVGEPVYVDVSTRNSYAVYGSIDNFSGISDPDNDGYYENYSFNVGIDGDATPGPATVFMKIICNTTGQSWWSSTSFSISGNAIDKKYFSFNQSYFASQLSDNTNLYFTVELWNSSKSILLASDVTVTGQPVKTDNHATNSYTVFGIIDGFSGITDADNDGYFENFTFRVGIDGDVNPGPSTVYMKVICNTTGQSWWSSTYSTITGNATDYKYFAFDQTDFTSHITANTSLDFTVELWNSSKTNLLATDLTVSGEPIKVDNSDSNTSNNEVITLLIVYTPKAAEWSRLNETNINTTIDLLMAKSQLVLDNSNVGITLRLVHSAQVDYTELHSNEDLFNLKLKDDGFMDSVHDLRSQFSADLVVLLEETEFTGGVGYLMSSASGNADLGFSLTRVQQASNSYTIIHEIGHNMGLGHHKLQNYQNGPGLFSFSSGWRWAGQDGKKYCTVMTYDGASYFADGIASKKIAYFSNPEIQSDGVSIGDYENADNARTLRETKNVIAAYSTGAEPPTLSVSSSNLSLEWRSGSTIDFSINSNTSWSISHNSDWLTITPQNGSNNGTVSILTNSANPSATSSRSATLKLLSSDTEPININITQLASNSSEINSVNGACQNIFYPNPTTGIIRLNQVLNSNSKISLYDHFGRLRKVWDNTIINANGVIEINISSYENGVYFLKINDSQTNKIQKVIKK